jgi:hypothetical protein
MDARRDNDEPVSQMFHRHRRMFDSSPRAKFAQHGLRKMFARHGRDGGRRNSKLKIEPQDSRWLMRSSHSAKR